MQTRLDAISNKASSSGRLICLRQFVRRGLKIGALTGVVIGGVLGLSNLLLLLITVSIGGIVGGALGLLTGIADGLAAEVFMSVFPAEPYPESGRRILYSLLIGGCALATNVVIFGLLIGPVAGGVVVLVPSVLSTVLALFAADDIFDRSLALPDPARIKTHE